MKREEKLSGLRAMFHGSSKDGTFIDLLRIVELMTHWGIIIATVVFYLFVMGSMIWDIQINNLATTYVPSQSWASLVSTAIVVFVGGVAFPALAAQIITSVIHWLLVATQENRGRIEREFMSSILLIMLMLTAYAWISWGIQVSLSLAS